MSNLLQKPIHLIYYSGSLGLRSGGPSGYLANLKRGLDETGLSDEFTITFLTSVKGKKRKKEKNLLKSIEEGLLNFPKLNAFYVNNIGKAKRKSIARRTKYLSELFSGESTNSAIIDFLLKHNNLRSIHCHNIFDAAEVMNTLSACGMRHKVHVMLTSHMPEAPSVELSNNFMEAGLSEKYVRPLRDICEKLQEKVFSEVDAIIFPSAEAIEPYYETIPGFEKLIHNQRVLFLLTGTIGLDKKSTKTEARNKLGISQDQFVVSFVGRHNSVKGYDLLCEAARKIFGKNLPICFIIGGRRNGCFSCPSDPRWKELGWVDPAEVLIAADLFVLPNKRTYFDLILLEAMSLGVNILASNTGGNKTVFDLTKCVKLVEADSGAIADEIIGQYENPELRKKEDVVKAQFDRLFTVRQFANNYQDLVTNYYRIEGILQTKNLLRN